MIAAIIAAAGSGERFGAAIPKALTNCGDRTLIEHALASISAVVDEIVITAPVGYEERFRELAGDRATVVTGGATRSESVRIGLAALPTSCEFVLVHDAARTPQGFSYELLSRAHAAGGDATDDAALVEKLGARVRVIDGEERAIKITTPSDLATALQYLGTTNEFSTGVGVDAHAFAEGRELYLAGLHWPGEVGVDGHSDGDVAAHAICDALFAASNLGDLGSNFGTARPEYAGASGSQLLQETARLVQAAGYSISHVSVQVIGNRPKIGTRRVEAIAALSSALNGADVALLATTTDGLGLTGEGKGIAAIASALITKI